MMPPDPAPTPLNHIGRLVASPHFPRVLAAFLEAAGDDPGLLVSADSPAVVGLKAEFKREGVSANLIGAGFLVAEGWRALEFVSWTHSKQQTGHGRRIRVYRLKGGPGLAQMQQAVALGTPGTAVHAPPYIRRELADPAVGWF